LADSYMQLHAGAILDRGGEGTLISYYHTIPAYLDHLRDVFLQHPAAEGKKPASPSGPPAPGDSSKP
jgi:hypothetical protein